MERAASWHACPLTESHSDTLQSIFYFYFTGTMKSSRPICMDVYTMARLSARHSKRPYKSPVHILSITYILYTGAGVAQLISWPFFAGGP